MNVVIVGGYLPYPATTGARIRNLSLVTRLARGHRITYVATTHPDRASASEARAYLRDHGIRVVEVDHTVPAKSGPTFYARLAANLASPLPYSVASFGHAAIAKALAGIASRERVDLWQAEWSGALASFGRLGDARTVVHAHNVETLIWERTAETEASPFRRWYSRGQARKYGRFERRAFARVGRVVTVSAGDAAIVRDRFGVDRVDVVDNGIDRAFFEAVRPDRDPKDILYLGSLDWRPNVDALNLLLDRIFPAVRAAEPSARLTVVGRSPSLALERRIAETEGASLFANVPDVRPYLARAGILAVPLRVGGGSRLKILEAMATGLPVVSSTVGAEGLELKGGEDLTLVDGPEEFASTLVATIREPGEARAMADRVRHFVLRRYDWDELARLMGRCWERAADEGLATVDMPLGPAGALER